jgi:hypothetical protein
LLIRVHVCRVLRWVVAGAQKFKLKGNYSEGFGLEKPTAKWSAAKTDASSADAATTTATTAPSQDDPTTSTAPSDADPSAPES